VRDRGLRRERERQTCGVSSPLAARSTHLPACVRSESCVLWCVSACLPLHRPVRPSAQTQEGQDDPLPLHGPMMASLVPSSIQQQAMDSPAPSPAQPSTGQGIPHLLSLSLSVCVFLLERPKLACGMCCGPLLLLACGYPYFVCSWKG
jgi:hypothetical protein